MVLILLCVVPFPNSFRAPGVVKAAERTQVANETSGTVEALLAKPGDTVKRGQPLLKLRNRELDLGLAAARAKLEEVNARLLKAMKDDSADVKPLSQLRDSVNERIAKLSADCGTSHDYRATRWRVGGAGCGGVRGTLDSAGQMIWECL